MENGEDIEREREKEGVKLKRELGKERNTENNSFEKKFPIERFPSLCTLKVYREIRIFLEQVISKFGQNKVKKTLRYEPF